LRYEPIEIPAAVVYTPKDVFRDDGLSGVYARSLGWEGLLQRHSTQWARFSENMAASKNKDLLSSDKMLFVGVKW
jgi:hypothetical protein